MMSPSSIGLEASMTIATGQLLVWLPIRCQQLPHRPRSLASAWVVKSLSGLARPFASFFEMPTPEHRCDVVLVSQWPVWWAKIGPSGPCPVLVPNCRHLGSDCSGTKRKK